MIPSPEQIRARLRGALSYLGRQTASVYRPDRDEHGGLLDTRQPIGRVAGYPYRKVRYTANIQIALPGQIDEDDPTVTHLMVMYGTRENREIDTAEYDPPEVEKDDVLKMAAGAEFRIVSAQDVLNGAYQLYRIKEM